MSKSAHFSKDSDEIQKFLSDKDDKFAKFAAKLAPALEKPDGPPVSSPAPSLVDPPVALREPSPPINQQVSSQAVSLTRPDVEPRRVGRPLAGKKPKVEKTFAIDDDLHRRLIRISNMEGLRLDKKFSVSGIMQHLLEYALSHAPDDKVMPGPDGFGLVIEQGEPK